MNPATPRKPSLTPTVLHPLSLPGFLTHLVSQPSPPQTTVIVCTSRSAFLADLLTSLTPAPQSNTEDQDQDQAAQPLLPPTLRTLLASQRIRLAFCASVPALHAYLAAYSGPARKPGAGADMAWKESEDEEEQHPVLVLLNPLALLAPTPAFSAQGLGRLVAAGVEAAGRAHARLLVVECVGAGAGRGRRGVVGEGEGEDVDMELGLDEEDAGDGEEVERRFDSRGEDPWEQDIPILNVSARRFGSGGGERGWAGRTVKARRVMERWCRFSSLEGC